MPINNIDVTVSAPKHKKRRLIILLQIVGFVFIVLMFLFVMNNKKLADHQPCLRRATLDANKQNKCLIALEIAQDPVTQEKGLGGRTSLPLNQGMLFVFSDDATRCFWMKDMVFHIDIVWLNANKEIVHIKSDVSPQTYPETFCPDAPAKYVLEINAGEAKNLQLKEGQQLQF